MLSETAQGIGGVSPEGLMLSLKEGTRESGSIARLSGHEVYECSRELNFCTMGLKKREVDSVSTPHT